MKQKKAQIKIQETAFMLVAVIFFFILVGLFVLSIWTKNIQDSAQDIAEERTLSAVANLAGTAEFICPENKPNCVDSDKLMALVGKKSYENFWEFSSLSVLKNTGFNKSESDWVVCDLGNYPDCDVIDVYNKNKPEKVISSFVALCRIESENSQPYEKCELAMLNAGTEIKKFE